MAAPAVVAVGAVASGTTTITPALPAGAAPGHILLTAAECTGGQAYAVPTGWAHVAGSPVNVDTTTALTVIWRRMVGGDTAPAIALPSGDHAIGRMIAVSGAKFASPPWNVTPVTAQETVADASADWPAITTTVADVMLLYVIGTGRDANSTANLGAMTGGTGLTAITEQMDNWILTGGGGGIGMITAVKAAAGACAVTTATMGSTDAKAVMVIPIEPAAVVPAGFVIPRRPDRGLIMR